VENGASLLASPAVHDSLNNVAVCTHPCQSSVVFANACVCVYACVSVYAYMHIRVCACVRAPQCYRTTSACL
jgi:hypothetical protein